MAELRRATYRDASDERGRLAPDRGPSLDEAPSTPWWHLLRRWRWREKRQRRDEARARRAPGERIRRLLDAMKLTHEMAGAQLDIIREMGAEAAVAGIAMREVTRPAPAEKPGPSRKVLL